MSDSKLYDEASRRMTTLFPALLSTQRSSWEQGCTAQAILEVYQSSLGWMDPHMILPYLYGLTHDAIVRQAEDGRLGTMLNGDGSTDHSAVDPACIGETIFNLLGPQPSITREIFESDVPRFKSGVEGMLKYILERCPCASVSPDTLDDILLSHRTDCIQIWSDTVYMLPPFLASAAVYYTYHTNPSFNPADLLIMSLRQIVLAAQVLQASSGEWSHVYDLEKHELKKPEFWGVGNGWVCGGIVRVLSTFASALAHDESLQTLLESPKVVEALKECYRILILTLDACTSHMRHDHLFHNVLNDSTTFIETNLSQQLSYTLYRLLDLRLHTPSRIRELLQIPALDEEKKQDWEYSTGAMYKVACRKTDIWGFVRGVCGSPRFDRSGTSAEGQAWAVLMQIARYSYLNEKKLRLKRERR